MVEVNHHQLELQNPIGSIARDSLYLLASATHSLLNMYEYPRQLVLSTYNRQGLLVLPEGLRPVFIAKQSDSAGGYDIAAGLPSLDRNYHLNEVLYSFELPEGEALTGSLAVQSVTRHIYARSPGKTPLKSDVRLTAGSVIRALAETMNKVSAGMPGWTFSKS